MVQEGSCGEQRSENIVSNNKIPKRRARRKEKYTSKIVSGLLIRLLRCFVISFNQT